ncbi:U6 snRNA-associated Sm-like protein LSm8 [Gonapodya prolifera JEL478]|uniref:LSM2-LSM8 complex subunit LSM8 n=1 Tax=Gonapodya prolifera (strain JEL478) TaxID=1344416 RepID=A0A139AWN9_GONPJ|nr:U6 snRNA-associated Sm-like protein LSm8 [Gonapodya prolifera JEL478]|eukprot:KXS21003.1 U6 snRNA-associated Sm-like protein LSm8 [Gonapodya prolifera JEL478]
MSEPLQAYMDKTVQIITNDGKVILGTLKGVDTSVNVVLHGSTERVFSQDEGVEIVPLGLYIIRGDNVGIVGLVDEGVDSGIEWSEVKAQPLGSVRHEGGV